MLFTPVCPHSLSFRPLLFPDTSTLQVMVSAESRGTNCASFDGRHRALLHPGDSLLISMSRFPLPSICRLDGTSDWFDGVRSVLQWNSRSANQKSLGGAAGHGGMNGVQGWQGSSSAAGTHSSAAVARATEEAARKRAEFQKHHQAGGGSNSSSGGGGGGEEGYSAAAVRTSSAPTIFASSSSSSAAAASAAQAVSTSSAAARKSDSASSHATQPSSGLHQPLPVHFHVTNATALPEADNLQHSQSAPPARDTPQPQA